VGGSPSLVCISLEAGGECRLIRLNRVYVSGLLSRLFMSWAFRCGSSDTLPVAGAKTRRRCWYPSLLDDCRNPDGQEAER
jgi:hypothetical protein